MKRIGRILIPLAGFLLILLAMNLYQYFRVKDDLASTVISEIGNKELGELRSFFDNLTARLNMVHDWGVNGVLDTGDVVALNKKFMPLIDRKDPVSGLLLADDQGREYFLYRDEKGWVTRISTPGGHGTKMVFRRWHKPDEPGGQWEKTDNYDPRKRPWFHSPSADDQVRWTPVYTFFETGEPGVTASVAWHNSGFGFTVFAVDVPLARMRASLDRMSARRPGILFLVSKSGGTVISSGGQKDAGVAEGPVRTAGRPPAGPAAALIRTWLEQGRPAGKPLSVQVNGQRWIASLRPLSTAKTLFWLGAAAPEQELLSRLDATLFKVDSMDILVAMAGALLLFFLVWRTGGLHRPGTEAGPPSPLERLHRCIDQGEGAEVEFKSTVRTNLKTGKQGKEIELAWLKAVVAFLNSNGGTLLLGVSDDGSLQGLAADNFSSPDRCLLHIKNLLNQHIGAEFARSLEVTMVAEDGRLAVLIECAHASEAVFLKIGKNEEFYIRSGPSSIRLTPSRMVSYILQNRNPAAG